MEYTGENLELCRVETEQTRRSLIKAGQKIASWRYEMKYRKLTMIRETKNKLNSFRVENNELKLVAARCCKVIFIKLYRKK